MPLHFHDYEHEYLVTITKEGTGKDTTITGEISYVAQEYDDTSSNPLHLSNEKTHQIEFDPLTILGDLKLIHLPKEHENTLHLPLNINKHCIPFVSEVKKIIQMNTYKSLDELELLRQKYEIALDCKIFIEKLNPYSSLSYKRNKSVKETTYVPLKYEFGKPNADIIQNEYLKENHQFIYKCYTVSEFLYAILHFIIIHEYTFQTCALCKRRYAHIPIQGQGKYCSRLSPLSLESYFITKKGKTYQHCFENLTCQKSMRKYNEIIRNIKKNKLCYASPESKTKFDISFDEKRVELNKDMSIHKLVQFFNWVRDYDIKS